MLYCSDNQLKAYCLEGNIYSGIWTTNFNSYEIIDNFKNKYKQFLIERHLL